MNNQRSSFISPSNNDEDESETEKRDNKDYSAEIKIEKSDHSKK
jgi:hypothetical protein